MSLLFPYIAVVCVSLLLAGYALAVGAGAILRMQILAVAIAGAVWGFWHSLTPSMPAPLVLSGAFLAEIILLLAWYGLLERLLRGPYLQSMPELVRRGVRWTWFILLAIAIVALTIADTLTPLISVSAILNAVLLTLSLLAFVLTAQLYGEATVEPHSALRGFCMAAALMTGAQAGLYATALLLGDVPVWMELMRSLAAIAGATLLALGMQSGPQWSLAIFVSPQARVYAPRLLTAASVLLLIIIAIPLFSALSPDVTHITAPLLVGALGIILALVLFSERLRAQLRVFISKHFLPFRYDYREEWLRLIDTLAAPGQERPLPERAIQCLAQIVSSPAGLLWMRASEGGEFHCVEGWNVKLPKIAPVAADDSVVRFMHDRQWILDTAELQRRPDLYPGLARPEWLATLPDALLIVPLISNETVIGFVSLMQSSSAFRLTFEEIDLLRTSGRQVAAHLAQFNADRLLAEAKQFEAFNRLTAFVMHDLKNLIAQQSLMVKNAAKHKNNPAFFEDAMATIENSVARMNKLLQQLQHGHTAGPSRRTNLGTCIREAQRKCEGREPEPVFAEPEEVIEVLVDAERFTTVLAHLIRNAQDATGGKGKVALELSSEQGRAAVVVRDDGVGMDEEFVRHRLFRPFDTTKGSQGMGIGAYQARSFVVAAGGTMSVDSKPGSGTSIRIELPLVADNVDTDSAN